MLETLLIWVLAIVALVFLGPFFIGLCVVILLVTCALAAMIVVVFLTLLYTVWYCAAYPFKTLYRAIRD